MCRFFYKYSLIDLLSQLQSAAVSVERRHFDSFRGRRSGAYDFIAVILTTAPYHGAGQSYSPKWFCRSRISHHLLNGALRRLRWMVGTCDHDLKANSCIFCLEVQLLGKREPYPVREANCQIHETKYLHLPICSEWTHCVRSFSTAIQSKMMFE